MLELLNDFNRENFLIKFYLYDEDVIAQATYVATDKSFNSDEYVALIGPSFSTISDNYYSKIIKIIWS
ncbi:YbjN domain-containing protein [Clostridium perfringens]